MSSNKETTQAIALAKSVLALSPEARAVYDDMLRAGQLARFAKGSLVYWITRSGMKQYAKIERINAKSVTVTTCLPDGTQDARSADWKVSIGLLRSAV